MVADLEWGESDLIQDGLNGASLKGEAVAFSPSLAFTSILVTDELSPSVKEQALKGKRP